MLKEKRLYLLRSNLMGLSFFRQLKLSQPKPDDLGFVDSVSVEEIGGSRVCLKGLL